MNKMKFEEFTNAVVEKIREYLPVTFANASVELQTVTKNNDIKLTGLTIRSAESNICPTIYLESFFENYQSGEDMGRVLEDIADVRLRNEVKDVFDIEQITNFSRVRDRIIPRLVGCKWNKELLERRPHTVIADLAATYHILLNEDMNGTASVPITNELMGTWGTDEKTLHELALKNMPVLLPSKFQPMSAVLGAMLGDDEVAQQLLPAMDPADEVMFILTNDKNMNGAAALLDSEIMQKIVEKFGEFFILPSSVHEVIIVPVTPDMDVATLSCMVQDVNASQVAPEERLSDHVYRYTLKDGLLPA